MYFNVEVCGDRLVFWSLPQVGIQGTAVFLHWVDFMFQCWRFPFAQKQAGHAPVMLHQIFRYYTSNFGEGLS